MRTIGELKKQTTINIKTSLQYIKGFVDSHEEVNGEIELYYPLNEGVFKLKGVNNTIGYSYFKVEEDERVKVEMYDYDTFNYELEHVTTFYLKGREAVVTDNPQNVGIKSLTSVMQGFIYCLGYVLVLKDNPKVITKTIEKNSSSSKKKSNSTIRKNINYIQGEKILYTISGDKEDLKTFKKKYQRHAESWQVMGYKRKLKNGKVIYIKPHVRGKNKDRIEKKEYIVK